MTGYVSRTEPGRLVMPASVADHARCRGLDTEAFFDHDPDTEAAAIKVCHACPVEGDCLAWALDYPVERDTDGVFGGTTAARRRAIRRALYPSSQKAAEGRENPQTARPPEQARPARQTASVGDPSIPGRQGRT